MSEADDDVEESSSMRVGVGSDAVIDGGGGVTDGTVKEFA